MACDGLCVGCFFFLWALLMPQLVKSTKLPFLILIDILGVDL